MARSILERIRKPRAAAEQYLVVVYARGGVGKTTLLGTIPGRGLVIDIPQYEGGDMVLVDKADRISIAPVKTWEELNELYLALRKGEPIGGVKYDWVAVDTGTACQQLARKKVLKERDEIASKPYVVRLQDWGSMGELMGQLFERFRLLPMPVYFTMQERIRRDESEGEDGERIIVPDISPLALRSLIPHPILIGRLYMHQNDSGDWERYLRVGPHASFITKARSVPGRRLPPVIRKPNLGRIVAWMRGEDVKPPRAAPDDTLIVDLEEGS